MFANANICYRSWLSVGKTKGASTSFASEKCLRFFRIKSKDTLILHNSLSGYFAGNYRMISTNTPDSDVL